MGGRPRPAPRPGGGGPKEKENLARLTALGAQLERLARAANPTLRDVDHALREAKDALDDPGPLATRRDRETVLARMESGRKALYPIWQQLREDTEWKRWANVSVQEELCAKAESLLEVQDLEKAAEQVRDLDARWKQAKEAPKEKGEALWNRFKAARDQVKARCDAFFAKQAEELAQSLKRKEELCARAEALAESTDWLKTAEELKKLQGEWKDIGPVHRAQSEAIWRRFRRPCDRFFARRKENQGQREREWSENLAKKDALCAQAEALQDSTDWEATTAEVKRLQGEWKAIGAVRKNKSEAIWQRFRKACDHFFERYKDRDNLERQAAAAAREALCQELEGLAPAEGTDAADPPNDLAARVQASQAAWRQAGEVSREQLEGLTGRFSRARNRLIEAWPRAFEGTDLDPDANRRKAEKLCARVEELLAQVGPPAAVSGADLAERLKNALATNTIGGAAAVEAKWQSAATEIESAQAAWQRLGPVPGETGRALLARFEAACRRFGEIRPRVVAPKPAGPRPARPGGASREPRESRPRRPGRLPSAGELLLRLVVGDRGHDDHVLPQLPVHGGGHLVPGGELDGVEHAQHLVEVAARAHGVGQDELDLLVGADHEHRAHGGVVRGRALSPRRVGVDHVVELRHVEVGVADDRIVGRRALGLLDVLGPLLVVGHGIDAQADHLAVALRELRLELGHVAELGGADRGEVLGVREQDGPPVSDPLVEVELAFRGLRREVRRLVSNAQ
ncbi:MAG: hypothetical protein DMF79_14145 [Acidobacteria bacterium]|nr:MAG: hypothetical protein DMF79_14145 [Acidobacteriota bacterium]